MNEIPILNIDKEFESVIPPLSDNEFENLKANILSDGEIYHPLIVWNNTIIDGHHRYKILKGNPGIKFRISEKSFDNRYEALIWICENQLGRRNLTDIQRTALMGRRYKIEKQMREFRGNQYTKVVGGQNVPPPHPVKDRHITSKKIAEEMGVNEKAVRRAEKFVDGMDAAEEVVPGISKEIISGEIKPTKADVSAIAKAPIEERKELAEKLRIVPTDEEKKAKQNRKNLLKAIRTLDATHIPSDTNKITPEDMLMTFQSEIEKLIDSMEFCLTYFPDLLTSPKYVSAVKKIVRPLKDYLKDLEENRYANVV